MPHPQPQVRQVGFPLDHAYIEQCWAPVIGPTSVLLLRRLPVLWREGMTAEVDIADLAQSLGLGNSTGRSGYAVQGATFEESTGRVDERTRRAEVYVDLTRGRNANHLYAARAEDPLDGERLPKAPPPPLDAALAIRLRASGAELTAWEFDPEALARTEPTIPTRSLA